MWLRWEILNWEVWWYNYIDMLEIAWGQIIWCWMDDLSSMRLYYKCDCVVECGIVERKMFVNTCVIICI
jgi:hypothetical protein